MYESISKNNELENEMTLDMSYFWYSDKHSFWIAASMTSMQTVPWTYHLKPTTGVQRKSTSAWAQAEF